MLDLINKFFSKDNDRKSPQRGNEISTNIHVATCALLLEMANIDGDFSEGEKERIVDILKDEYGLSDEYALELIKASKSELDGSIDLWKFTNLINRNYQKEEKIRIIELVWKVVYADKKLDKYEDYLVHKLAKLLDLTHRDLIAAKIKIKNA